MPCNQRAVPRVAEDGLEPRVVQPEGVHVERLDGERVRIAPEGVPTRAEDFRQAVVLPQQRPLRVSQIHHGQRRGHVRISQQHVEQLVREARIERVVNLNPGSLIAPQPTPQAVLARTEQPGEVPVAKQQTTLILANPRQTEHDQTLLSKTQQQVQPSEPRL
jgi:hypothetical protein